jgi:uncharacterized protein
VTVDIRDLDAIRALLGREPRALAGVAARCPAGAPAVIAQRPYDRDGTPFPTTHWLCCRALVRAISAFESEGGVRALGEALATESDLRSDAEAAEHRVRRLRAALDDGAARCDGGASLATGIGGVERGGGIKCLHAHAAVALAAGPHALGERALQLAGARFPVSCCIDEAEAGS